jgi:UDP-2,3-diacylglucosamine pyrophosphatase LpxH
MGSDGMSEECPERRFRTLFISDVHLGARGSQADRLLDFLRTHDADAIYLVGDIVDGWALQSSWYWPQSHNDFVQKMLRKARKGAKVIYVPGNHDEFLRNYYGTHFGGIDVVENIIHEGADGRRYLVIHGDIFDLVVQNARWLAHLGDKAYDFAIRMNRIVNVLRRWFGVPYWSLSQWAKLKVKNAVNYIGAFEQTLAGEARRHGADGVICGHIHTAAIRDQHGIRYMNCGDWVESCTALAEHDDGRFEIITWSDCKKEKMGLSTSEVFVESILKESVSSKKLLSTEIQSVSLRTKSSSLFLAMRICRSFLLARAISRLRSARHRLITSSFPSITIVSSP